MIQRPTKAVIAAAGFGTRFLPQTKAIPKEMLPLIDKPIIQHIVEELVEAGIKDIIIVTGQNKRSIEDHFDTPSADLVATLQDGGKIASLEHLREISNMANFVYVRQKEPLGNAAPLLSAGHLIRDEPFIYAFADDFIDATPSRFQQMIDVYAETGGSVLSCIRLQKDGDYDKYGVVAGEEVRAGLIKMNTIAEKPGKANAPSAFGSVSSYVFTGNFLDYVQRTYESFDRNSGEELKIQTAMQLMMDEGHPYFGLEIADGRFYDAGDKLEYLKTVVDFALRREDIGEDFRVFLQQTICDHKE
jgi:UTP--glucose-1-phosphate uridylyltransferase